MWVYLCTDVAVSVCSACAEYVVSYYPSATTCAPKHANRQPNKKPREETTSRGHGFAPELRPH